jgi:hypothetical protein
MIKYDKLKAKIWILLSFSMYLAKLKIPLKKCKGNFGTKIA